jgi:hypothetical protein
MLVYAILAAMSVFVLIGSAFVLYASRQEDKRLGLVK